MKNSHRPEIFSLKFLCESFFSYVAKLREKRLRKRKMARFRAWVSVVNKRARGYNIIFKKEFVPELYLCFTLGIEADKIHIARLGAIQRRERTVRSYLKKYNLTIRHLEEGLQN
jgi:hypothetical protein